MPFEVAFTTEEADDCVTLSRRQALGAASVLAMQMFCGAKAEKQHRAGRDHSSQKNSFLGTLFLAGGGNEDALIGDLVKTAGPDAKVAICSHASGTPVASGNSLRETFIKAGIKPENITVVLGDDKDKLPVDKSPFVEDDALKRDAVNYANCVPDDANVLYFSGGDQERLMRLFKQSKAVSEFLDRGGIVGGTSAGEMTAGDLMIAGKMKDGILRRDELRIAPGMGLMHGLIFESHAGQRERGDNRALAALALRDELRMGFVVDERAYLRIRDGVAVVCGENNVKVVTRGRHFSSNLARDDGRPPYLSGGNISIYSTGCEIKIPNWARMDGRRLQDRSLETPARFKAK